MEKILKLSCSAVLMFLISAAAISQTRFGDIVEFDKTVHDFGDVLLTDGPLKCTFNVKNISGKPLVIYNVTSSCGCTDVSWTKQPLKQNETGTVSVTYSNNDGPYPFDKNLTVYISDVQKPVILKIRGVAHERELPPEELYTIRFGPLGMKDNVLKCGNIDQGGERGDQITVANLSSAPVSVTFKDVTPGLSLKVSPNPIPANGTATMQFVVKADRKYWGKNYFYAVPVVNGKSHAMSGKPSERTNPLSYIGNLKDNSGKIAVYAFIKENFDSLTASERSSGPIPMFKESTYSFGKLKKGGKIEASFQLSNNGKRDFKVYKVDVDAPGASYTDIPIVPAGGRSSFKVILDTNQLPSGEVLVMVTLTTNSPLRPIVNLIVTGWLE